MIFVNIHPEIARPAQSCSGEAMRILHGPVNVGNQPWALSRAERALGAQSDVVVSFQTWLGYRVDRVLTAEPEAKSWADKLRRARFGIEATGRYDVLHYYFGQSYIYRPGQPETLVSFADLRLAKARGKKVFMTLQGCDVRGAAVSHATHAVTMCKPEGGCQFYANCAANQDKVRRKMVEDILPLCDRVFVLNPDLARHAPGAEFMPYASASIRDIAVSPPRTSGRPLILHAPSDPLIKGTAEIEAALDELRAEFDFDYQVVKGLPHEEAMKLYQRADLVIDQILAGWYGGFAVEVMAMGKPVAAYIRQEDLPAVPADFAQDMPILRIDRRSLVEDLRGILRRQSEWAAIGARSRAFVERWHDPAAIAAALLRLYADPGAAFRL
jgi:hypothetical protein